MGDPVWTWKLVDVSPSQPGFSGIGDGSSFLVESVGSGTPESGAFVGGQYTVTVTAVATWKDSTGETYTSDTGTGTATFFVRVPKAVVVNGSPVIYYHNGPDFWGHKTLWPLEMVDNQFPPQAYKGGWREAFSGYQANPDYAQDLAGQKYPAPGTPTQITPPSETNYDQNEANTSEWKTPPVTATTHDPNAYWYQLDQTWHCMETAPGFPNMSYDTALNTHHITHYESYATRYYITVGP